MSDLLQEIDDAVRRDKAEKFWKENAPYIVGGAIALVILTAAMTGWNSWKLKTNTAQTGLLIGALETPFPETALEAALGGLKGNHKALAQIQAAGLSAKSGDLTKAVALYRGVAGGKTYPKELRDLATIMAVSLEWTGSTEESAARKMLSEIKPVMSKDNPWSSQATLLAATITGDGLKDYKNALGMLNGLLSDQTVPPSVSDRAKILNHLYSMEAAKQAKASGNATGTSPKKDS